jgi:UDP-glucose 4-epimerase
VKTLVTGGAGYIGSHVVDLLIKEGHEVNVMDNFDGGNPRNLAHLAGNPRLSIHDADLNDHTKVAELFAGIDWAFHLAGLADIVPSINDPMKYHRANVDGTVSVLEAARNGGVKRFIYAASSSCYGIPDLFPTPEDSEIRPMYPYALTKFLGEQCVMHWNKIYKLPVVSLRLFNVYGPRSRTSGTYGAVFGVFLAQKLAGKPLTIVGDGTQTRDFTFVTDVARAFVKAADSDLNGEIMNVGSGQTYSVNRLTQLIGGETVYLPKRPGEPDCTFADNRKLCRSLDWQPEVSLEEGVGVMLEQIHLWKEAPVWDANGIAEATRDWFKYLGNEPESESNE